MGPSALEGAGDFLRGIAVHADEMRAAGRSLFERWLDRVVAAAPTRSL